METDHLISRYTNRAFPITFIQFLVPDPNKFRQSGTCSVKINKVVKKFERMPWEEWLKVLT